MREFRGVAARRALGGFGDMVGELGEGFGVADANAAGDADPLQDARSQFAAAFGSVAANTGEIDKVLVDGVNLLCRAEAFDQARHTLAHIAVQFQIS